jgi:hypothetical protein
MPWVDLDVCSPAGGGQGAFPHLFTLGFVHAFEVLKGWDEHELGEDIAGRESMLRPADRLEEQAKICGESGWS